MDKFDGLKIERGKVLSRTENGIVAESYDRPGYVTVPMDNGGRMRCELTDTEYIFHTDSGARIGDTVFFAEGADGIGILIGKAEGA